MHKHSPAFFKKKPMINIYSIVTKKQLSVVAASGLLIVVFSQLSPYFLTARNFQSILRNMPELGLLAVGMSIVMIAGGIDISAEAILGLVAILIGKLLLLGLPGWVSALIGPFAGAMLGFINGVVIAYGRILPIIATLGAMYVWRALIFLLVGARWLAGLPHIFDPVVKRSIWGIPLPFLIFLAITLVLEFAFRQTHFGWHIRAIGDNGYSARLAGVRIKRMLVLSYTLLGFLAGVSALFYVGKYRNVEMTVAAGMSLEAIAAAVIGGTSILGGEGSIVGCLIGVFFIRLIQNGLVLLRVPSIWDYLVLGGLIAIMSVADLVMRRRSP